MFFWPVGVTPAVCCYSQDTQSSKCLSQCGSEVNFPSTYPPSLLPLLQSLRSSFLFQVSSINDSLLSLQRLKMRGCCKCELELEVQRLLVPCIMTETGEGSCLHSWGLLIKSSWVTLIQWGGFWDTNKAASGMWLLLSIRWRLNPKTNACNIYRRSLRFPSQAKCKETPKVKQMRVLKVEWNMQAEKSSKGGWHKFMRYFLCDVFLLMSAYLQTRERESRAVV